MSSETTYKCDRCGTVVDPSELSIVVIESERYTEAETQRFSADVCNECHLATMSRLRGVLEPVTSDPSSTN